MSSEQKQSKRVGFWIVAAVCLAIIFSLGSLMYSSIKSRTINYNYTIEFIVPEGAMKYKLVEYWYPFGNEPIVHYTTYGVVSPLSSFVDYTVSTHLIPPGEWNVHCEVFFYKMVSPFVFEEIGHEEFKKTLYMVG